MDIKIASLLADYNCRLELQEDYRGRGMSKETAAISGELCDLLDALCEVFIDYEFEDDVQQDDIRYAMRRLSVDNLGKSYIFY